MGIAIPFYELNEKRAIVENGRSYKLIHSVALFARANDCKESKRSSAGDQFNEWQIYTMEYYAAIKRMGKLSAAMK